MKEFIDYINSLIADCGEISMLILSNEDCSEKLSTFCSQMLNFVSQIYELYSTPEYSGRNEDIQNWILQIQRLTEACSGNDLLYLVDIIDYEIKNNLTEVIHILEG